MILLSAAGLPGLPEPKSGKVRDVFDLGDELLIVSTDRISAFDVCMANGIPGKGEILNQMSLFWFERLREIVPNHIITGNTDAIRDRFPRAFDHLVNRSVIAKKARVIPFECVARGYITGSLLKAYRSEGRDVLGLDLPDGLCDGSRLPEPIFTPATKAEAGHDENVTFHQMVDSIGFELAGMLRQLTLDLYQAAADHAESRGLILADTKFEFGLVDDGLIWIDEALTPDSSRYWDQASWKPGESQPSYDKQFVRDYLESIHWNKQPPGPALPEEVVEGTRERYKRAFDLVTGPQINVVAL